MFGALLVILAILVAAFIPETPFVGAFRDSEEDKRRKQLEDKRRSDDSYEEDSDSEMEYKMPLISDAGNDML